MIKIFVGILITVLDLYSQPILAAESTYSFSFTNTKIIDVIKKVSEITKESFVVDPQVRGVITIINQTPLSKAQIRAQFLTMLAVNGFNAVKMEGFEKIMSSRNIQRSGLRLYKNEEPPNNDQYTSLKIDLKYVSAYDLQKNLRVLSSKDGDATPLGYRSILVSDYNSNLARIFKLIKDIDKKEHRFFEHTNKKKRKRSI